MHNLKPDKFVLFQFIDLTDEMLSKLPGLLLRFNHVEPCPDFETFS